jgi:Polyketide cyclase / dehydrase and lipid transport
MIRVNETVVIRAVPAHVWHKISDYAFDAQWRDGLIEMNATPPGPAALGTRVSEVLQRGGRTYVGTTTVDEIEPGVGYRFSGEGPSGRINGSRTVQPGSIRGTTQFTYAFDLQPRLFIRALGPIATRIARSAMKRDLKTLRTILEHDMRFPSNALLPDADSCE